MADRVVCPVKADTIGNAGYLRWVQFCERTCPYCKDEAACCHPTTLSFPAHTKELEADKVAEVEEAWKMWIGSFTSSKLPENRTF